MNKKITRLSAVTLSLPLSNSSLLFANDYHFIHQMAHTGSACATSGTATNDINAIFSNPSSIICFTGTRVSADLAAGFSTSRAEKFRKTRVI